MELEGGRIVDVDVVVGVVVVLLGFAFDWELGFGFGFGVAKGGVHGYWLGWLGGFWGLREGTCVG